MNILIILQNITTIYYPLCVFGESPYFHVMFVQNQNEAKCKQLFHFRKSAINKSNNHNNYNIYTFTFLDSLKTN
jgi:hypothetical protein